MRSRYLALLLLAVVGCAQENAGQPPGAADLGTLSGEVFIVTRGGPSIKLGLVNVVAIPEEEMRQFLEAKKLAISSALETSQQEYLAAQAAIAELKQEIVGAEAKAAAAEEAERDAMRRFREVIAKVGQRTMEHPERGAKEADESDRYLREIERQRAIASARRQSLAAQEAAMNRFEERRQHLASSEFYFADLPAGIASAKTNADGLFTITIPRQERFALAARASRSVGDEIENYYWLVWASLDGAPDKRVLLSNDNLTTVAAPESVVTLSN